MAVVLQALVQPGLVYERLASGGPGTGAGPLVSGLNPAEAAYYALANPKALLQYVNRAVLEAEKRLPEGARVQLEITGWTVPLLGSQAARVAADLNRALAEGRIRDPDTGEPIKPWPEHPDRIAFAVGDTVVLRWIKGQAWVFNMVRSTLIFAAVTAAVIWLLLSRASWSMYNPRPPLGPVSPAPLSTLERAALVGGLLLLLGAYIWYRAEVRLREAGAPKQTFVIER